MKDERETREILSILNSKVPPVLQEKKEQLLKSIKAGSSKVEDVAEDKKSTHWILRVKSFLIPSLAGVGVLGVAFGVLVLPGMSGEKDHDSENEKIVISGRIASGNESERQYAGTEKAGLFANSASSDMMQEESLAEMTIPFYQDYKSNEYSLSSTAVLPDDIPDKLVVINFSKGEDGLDTVARKLGFSESQKRRECLSIMPAVPEINSIPKTMPAQEGCEDGYEMVYRDNSTNERLSVFVNQQFVNTPIISYARESGGGRRISIEEFAGLDYDDLLGIVNKEDMESKALKFLQDSGFIDEAVESGTVIAKGWDEYICPQGEVLWGGEYDENGGSSLSGCAIVQSSIDNLEDYPVHGAEDGFVDSASAVSTSRVGRISSDKVQFTNHPPRLASTTFDVYHKDLPSIGDDFEINLGSITVSSASEVIRAGVQPLSSIEHISVSSQSAEDIFDGFLKDKIKPIGVHRTNNVGVYDPPFHAEAEEVSDGSSSSSSAGQGPGLSEPAVLPDPDFESTDQKNKVEIQKAKPVYSTIYSSTKTYMVPAYRFEGEITCPEPEYLKNIRADRSKENICQNLIKKLASYDHDDEIAVSLDNEKEISDTRGGVDNIINQYHENQCWVFEADYEPDRVSPYSITLPASADFEIKIEN
jgi:hypothetical protein